MGIEGSNPSLSEFICMKQAKKKLIIFAGGGTGGHVYPILAVYEYLKEYNNLDFLYFCSEGKIEEKICQENNIKSVILPLVGGLPRGFSFGLLAWFFKLIYSSFLAIKFLAFSLEFKQYQKVVFSTGGYGSAPILLAANLLRIPYILHNLDSHLGLANQVFADKAQVLTYGMNPLENKFLPKNGSIIISGNPVAKAFKQNISPEEKSRIIEKYKLDSNRKTLIITGGSQGSQFLNKIILEIVPNLIRDNWQIIHQLGSKQFQIFQDKFINNPNYKPQEYINDLALLYSISDLAITRSGAMTISELISKKLPSILIPLPTSAQNHQFYNAKFLADQGCVLLLEQKPLNPEALIEKINFVYSKKALFKLGFKEIDFTDSAKLLGNIILKSLY